MKVADILEVILSLSCIALTTVGLGWALKNPVSNIGEAMILSGFGCALLARYIQKRSTKPSDPDAGREGCPSTEKLNPMVQPPEVQVKSMRVFYFMSGFRKAANGSCISNLENTNPDFKRGHTEGKTVLREAHKQFCAEIGHNPLTDILRSTGSLPEPEQPTKKIEPLYAGHHALNEHGNPACSLPAGSVDIRTSPTIDRINCPCCLGILAGYYKQLSESKGTTKP